MQPVSSVPVTTRGMMRPIHMKQGAMHKHGGCKRRRRARAAQGARLYGGCVCVCVSERERGARSICVYYSWAPPQRAVTSPSPWRMNLYVCVWCMVTASTDGRSGLRSNTAQRHTPSGLLDTVDHRHTHTHTHCYNTHKGSHICMHTFSLKVQPGICLPSSV